MLSIARLFSALAITLCFIYSMTLAQNSKDEQSSQSSVSGRVTLGGKPVRGVVVGLLPHNRPVPNQPGQIPKAKTDAEGNYRITGAAAGYYRLAPLSSVYAMSTANGMGLQGIPITLGENEHLENIDLQLTAGGVITGRVTDQNGKPVIEANISIEPEHERDGRPPAIPRRAWNTDDRGIYRIFGLPDGKYKIAVHLYSSNALSTRVYYPGTPERSQAKTIEVSSGSEATDIDIKVGNSGGAFEISGRVVDDAGKVVPNVSLEYRFMESHRGSFGSAVRVNADGTFRLQGLLPGTFVLMAREGAGANTNWYGEPLKLELQSADIKGVDVKVQRGATISGTVIIEGISDVSKIPNFSQHKIAGNTQPLGREMFYSPKTSSIEAGGAFRLTGIAPGRVYLGLTFFNIPEASIKLVRVEHNGQDVTRGFKVGA
ncbi:MAG TPA: carboxypeptidase-like regulatory domain-containing protein, partial [Blastocatellia bacterium]|nr:carboxypeptidase-like regulatory domain-containing protein [Blastocatellia bacterium]